MALYITNWTFMELYLFLILSVIPCVYYAAANGSHDYLAIIFSFVIWIFWIINGVPFNVSVYSLVAWLALSVFWSSQKESSIFDLFVLSSFFTVALAVKYVDISMAMMFSFLPVPGMAALEIYQLYKGQKANRRGSLFGNTNHSGVYFTINFFIGLWLSFNVSFVFLPFVILVMAGIFASTCRGAILSLCIGMGVLSAYIFNSWFLIVPMAIIGVVAVVLSRGGTIHEYVEIMKYALGSRGAIFMKTITMIKNKPIFGYGLNMFRSEHPYFVESIIITHRTHNDLLEITFETGIIGLFLCGYFFYNLSWNDPFISAGIVAGLISSLFFFTFREAHTAGPMMILCGYSLNTTETITIPLWLSALIILFLLNMFYGTIIKRLVALYWFAVGSTKKDPDEQINCLAKSLKYNQEGEALWRYSRLIRKNSPEESLNAAIALVYNYDGVVTLWVCYDELARACLRMGSPQIAAFFNQQSLACNPYFEASLKLKGQLDQIFNQLRERKNDQRVVEVH